jgi:catechol 2,3-dioxygenase-like lactoylglutathione lyase family enzyme
MPIEGISHITIMVKDLERSANLFTSVFGAKQVYSSGEQHFSQSKEIYFVIGGVWVALMEGSSLPEMTYNHIAFKIPESEFEDFKRRIKSAGVDYRAGRSRIPGEGLSLYFYDFDGHLYEFHTGTLEDRLEAYGQHGQTHLNR